MYQWFRIAFIEPFPKTDLWKYRSMSEMLVPWKDDTNRFRMVCSHEMTDFYIGSNGPESMSLLRAFFSRMYPMKFEVVDDQEEPESYFLYMLSSSKEKRPYYAISLLQNLSRIHMISDRKIIVDVAVYRSGMQNAKVSLRVGTPDKHADLSPEKEYVKRIMKKFKSQTGVKSRRARRHSFYITRPFYHTFLVNLMRIPEDEDPI